jgi:predicted RNA methylase
MPIGDGKHVLVDGHHRFLSWKAVQNSLPAENRRLEIKCMVLPAGLSKTVLIMISICLNFQNETMLQMNMAGISKTVSKLLKSGYSYEAIIKGTGGRKMSIKTIPQYTMVYRNLINKKCFPLFEYICNLQSYDESPFKLGIMIKVNKGNEYALRGWMLEVAQRNIPDFKQPENIYHPAKFTPQELDAQLAESGQFPTTSMVPAGEEAQPESDATVGGKKPRGKKSEEEKRYQAQEIHGPVFEKWERRSVMHAKTVDFANQRKGQYNEALLVAFQEKIYAGSYDKFSVDSMEWKTAVHKVFRSEAEEQAEESEGVAGESAASAAAGSGLKVRGRRSAAAIRAIAKAKKEKQAAETQSKEFLCEEFPVAFRHGDSRHDFSRQYLAWSRNKKAQLCLCDPPWGITDAKHDKDWNTQDWTAFVKEVNTCMNEDGVIIMFVAAQIIGRLETAMATFGWTMFRQPMIWVHKSPVTPYKMSRQPYSAHCLLMAFIKTPEFQVKIDKELETAYGFGRSTNLFHNVFVLKRTGVFRQKPKAMRGKQIDEEQSAAEEEEAGEEVDEEAKPAKNLAQRFRSEQKPLELLQMLIRRYAPGAGDIVIDPTFGTGSGGIASMICSCDDRIGKRYFFGMDSDPLALQVAESWVKEHQKKCKFFLNQQVPFSSMFS